MQKGASRRHEVVPQLTSSGWRTTGARCCPPPASALPITPLVEQASKQATGARCGAGTPPPPASALEVTPLVACHASSALPVTPPPLPALLSHSPVPCHLEYVALRYSPPGGPRIHRIHRVPRQVQHGPSIHHHPVRRRRRQRGPARHKHLAPLHHHHLRPLHPAQRADVREPAPHCWWSRSGRTRGKMRLFPRPPPCRQSTASW